MCTSGVARSKSLGVAVFAASTFEIVMGSADGVHASGSCSREMPTSPRFGKKSSTQSLWRHPLTLEAISGHVLETLSFIVAF
jgi:hypothetical protein